MSWQVMVEPLALIGYLMLALAFVVSRRGTRVMKVIFGVVAVAYLWFTSPLGANVMLSLLEHHPSGAPACPDPAAGDVVVVLAGGIDLDDGDPASADMGRLHEATMRRVMGGVRVAHEAGARMILSGGSGGAVREADLMRALAQSLGVDASRLAVERESRNTYDSATQVARMLRARDPGGGRVYLVTSALHMPRAAASFRARGITVCPRPVDRQWVRPPARHALIPQASALRKSTAAYHEALGLAAYWAAGRLDPAP